MRVEVIIKVHMAEHQIEHLKVLAKLTGIDYQRLMKRMKHPETFTVYELRALNEVLGFTDEEVGMICR